MSDSIVNSTITFNSRDEYNRKPIAERLINLLDSEYDIDVSPIVIDGGWGAGKTEFAHKLVNLLKEDDRGFEAVYIDAYQEDQANQPMMTLLSAVLRLLPEEGRERLIKKALPAIRFGLKTMLKSGVSWALRQDFAEIADDFDNDLKKAGDQVINHTIERLIKDHTEANKSIHALKEALIEVAGTGRIIVLVDELDRCRPDFAVSILETIKHIFDVSGVDFILVANMSQLKASINHCYGYSVDSQRYLDKFIKFAISFSDESIFSSSYKFHTSCKHFFSQFDDEIDYIKDNSQAQNQFIKEMIKNNQLSLRECESFARYIKIYVHLANGKGISNDAVLGAQVLRIFGIYLVALKPALANDICNGRLHFDEIYALFGDFDVSNIVDDDYSGIGQYYFILSIFKLMDSEIGAEHISAVEIFINRHFQGVSHIYTGPDDALRQIKSTIRVLQLAE